MLQLQAKVRAVRQGMVGAAAATHHRRPRKGSEDYNSVTATPVFFAAGVGEKEQRALPPDAVCMAIHLDELNTFLAGIEKDPMRLYHNILTARDAMDFQQQRIPERPQIRQASKMRL